MLQDIQPLTLKAHSLKEMGLLKWEDVEDEFTESPEVLATVAAALGIASLCY